MKLFVEKNDQIEVKVYVWSKDGKLDASNSVNDAGPDCETLTFYFKKPSYSDGLLMLGAGLSGERPDLVAFESYVMANMLKDWDLKENGEKVPFSLDTMRLLDPKIGQWAYTGFMTQIKLR